MSKINENIAACSYMAIAMFCFVVNDAVIRTVGKSLPLGQILFLRNSFLVVLLILLMIHLGQWRQLPTILSPRVTARSLLEVVGSVAFLYALLRIPFANTAAILQCLPLAVTLGATLFFGERVGVWRWCAIVIGFAGVVIILRPGLEGFTPPALWLLLTVFCAAGRDLIARSLPQSIPASVVSLSTAALIAFTGAIMVAFQDEWVAVSPSVALRIAAAALLLVGAYQCIVLAMRTGDIGFVAPFRYTSLLWAIFLGWLMFDELPDHLTIAGSTLIVAMGLLSLYRETVIRRKPINRERVR